MNEVKTLAVHYKVFRGYLDEFPESEEDFAQDYRLELMHKALAEDIIRPGKKYVISFEQKRLVQDDYPINTLKVTHYLHVQDVENKDNG